MNKDTKAEQEIEETGKKDVEGQDHPPADPHDKALGHAALQDGDAVAQVC